MIEWLISFGNGCHYITMAFLLLYLLWLVRESFRTRKSGVVREEIMCSDDAGKCFLALWLAAEYLMRENFPFSLYPHYTAWKYWIAWPLLILCVIMEKSIKYRGFRIMIRRGISALFGKLDNARDFIERGSHGPQRWVILFILVIFGQSFVSIPDIAASPDLSKSIEFFVVLAISILYSLAAIYKAMYSATWLCITWFFGTVLFGAVLYDVFSGNLPAFSVLQGNGFLLYCFLVVVGTFWWCLTICWAEARAALLASSLISTVIGLITGIANIILLVIRPALTNVPAGADADLILSLAVNLFLLPLLAASLLSRFVKELQIYWREKHPW